MQKEKEKEMPHYEVRDPDGGLMSSFSINKASGPSMEGFESGVSRGIEGASDIAADLLGPLFGKFFKYLFTHSWTWGTFFVLLGLFAVTDLGAALFCIGISLIFFFWFFLRIGIRFIRWSFTNDKKSRYA